MEEIRDLRGATSHECQSRIAVSLSCRSAPGTRTASKGVFIDTGIALANARGNTPCASPKRASAGARRNTAHQLVGASRAGFASEHCADRASSLAYPASGSFANLFAGDLMPLNG